MIVLYIKAYTINSKSGEIILEKSICEITNINSIFEVDSVYNNYFDKNKYLLDEFNNEESKMILYFIDSNKAYDGAPSNPYDYSNAEEAYKNICSFIEYDYYTKFNTFKRFEGYGRFDSSIPYHELQRRELNDLNLKLYSIGTKVRFINPDTNESNTGIIVAVNANDLRTYEIYSFNHNIIYSDDYEPIHNNEIIETFDMDLESLKSIVNSHKYMYTKEYIDYINSL